MNLRIFNSLLTSLLVLLLISSFSCEEEKIKLRPADIIRIDTLFNTESKLIKTRLDSICTSTKEERFNAAVDSIMKIRLEERKRTLGY